MMHSPRRRARQAKVVATLGPASSDPTTIARLFEAGADVFRLNFSHGDVAEHRNKVELLRELEQSTGRPIAILADLQGPKLRVGVFTTDSVHLETGQAFQLDLDPTPGDCSRVCLPHPEVLSVLESGTELLLDDGRVRLRVESCAAERASTRVLVGGRLSARKGVNVPGTVLPITALTPKDRQDLEIALSLGVDWVALSFVQRPADVAEAQALIGGRAVLVVKLEKPSAIDHLQAVVELADAVMVARGDLGVELPAEQVPVIQKRIIRLCRRLGKPVIVATQMLESMVDAPVPTRAEASDVATAIYEGADAVMLSAESATGRYPVEAVTIMDRIIREVESDPDYRALLDASHVPLERGQASVAESVCCALRRTAGLLPLAAIVCCTTSGATSVLAARERPQAPLLSLTPNVRTARWLALVWGVHSVVCEEPSDVSQVIGFARLLALREGFARSGDMVIAIAGVPFGASGSTNLMRVVTV